MKGAALAFVLLFFAPFAAAQSHVDRLADTLDLPGLARLISAEGHAMWSRFDSERLDGQGGPVWAAQVARLYDPARIETTLRDGLRGRIEQTETETALVFLQSDLGQRIVALDLQARAALQDADLLAAVQARVAQQGIDPQIDRIIAAGRLIDRNVVLGLNWQVRFQQGLARGGALDASDDEITARVLAGEEAVRESLRGMLLAHLALALSPLEPDALARYADYSETDAGQAVNAALFTSVEAFYDTLAFAMGQAAALFLPGDDI